MSEFSGLTGPLTDRNLFGLRIRPCRDAPDSLHSSLRQNRPAPALARDGGDAKLKDIYEEAAREWIARQIRGRGHEDFKRSMVRKPRFDIDQGWPGTDVTPGDDPAAALMCEIKGSSGWHEHGERVYSVSDFLRECSEIVRELDTTSPEAQARREAEEAKAEAERSKKRLAEMKGIVAEIDGLSARVRRLMGGSDV